MSKKAYQSVIMYLIIALIVIILVLTIFGDTLFGKLSKSKRMELCKLSVEAKSKQKLLMLGSESPFFLDCSTNYITINSKGIYSSDTPSKIGEQEVSFSGRTTREKDDSIKLYLANEMHDCWYQLGEGKIDFLGSDAWVVSQFRCFPCTEIAFEDNFLNGLTYGDFERYLENTKIIQSDISYKDYLKSNKDKNKQIYKSNYSSKEMSTQKGGQLTITYDILNPAFFVKPSDWLGIIDYAVQDVKGYKTNLVADIYLVDSKDVSGKCQKIY